MFVSMNQRSFIFNWNLVASSTYVGKVDERNLWHKRLGHVN